MTVEGLLESMVAIVGSDRARADSMERQLYSHDLAALPKLMEMGFKTIPDVVVRPASAEQVSAIMRYACENGVPVVPRGGASWGLGGAVPCQGGISLDLTSMNAVLRVDPDAMEVEVEAGASWQKVVEAAAARGLFIGYYPSSAPAATVGGWISTGGIGTGTYKYGSVAANVRDMEVVLPQGDIIHTGFSGVSDHSSGYGLGGLLAGAEGTLGVITRVVLKAVPAPEVVRPVSVMAPGLVELVPLMRSLAASRVVPWHVSFVDARHLEFKRKVGKHVPGQGAVLNLILEGSKEQVEVEDRMLGALIAKHGLRRLSDEDARHEWEENFYEFRVREVGVGAAAAEVVVPLKALPAVLAESYDLIARMKMEAAVVGILGDRSTVLLMPYYLYDEKKLVKGMVSLSFPKKMGDLASRHGGRQLGFGLFFAQNLARIRGDTAPLMFDLKTVIDPCDVLNPGKLLEGLTRFGIPLPGAVMGVGMGAMALGKKALPRDKAFERRLEGFEPRKPHPEEKGAAPGATEGVKGGPGGKGAGGSGDK